MSGPAVWRPVIGLEVHVQLRTRTKMFCADAALYGGPPNSRICPVCLGLPGALPALNRRAVELGVVAALGLHCTVQPRSTFDRKSYFYPDLPKGYQITQKERPLATGGFLDVELGGETRRVRIRRVHLEEDAGRSLHDLLPDVTALDFNRAGIPLVEIVTEPDLASPAGARAFLTRLKQVLEYLGVSDCIMEEGSLRVDANVSVAPDGERGSRTELKNLNSFANVERALDWEIARQTAVRRAGGSVEAATLAWDADLGEARRMRSKEELHEYRHHPEPDVGALDIDGEWLERMRRSLPEMPWIRAARLIDAHGLAREHADALTRTRALADSYEQVVKQGAEPREAASWLLGEVSAAANLRGCAPEALPIRPAELATLIRMVTAGELSRTAARRAFSIVLETGAPVAEVVEREGLRLISDPAALRGWVEDALVAHPAEARRLRSGEHRLIDFFMGEVMRRSGGRAEPGRVASAIRVAADAGGGQPGS